MTPPMTPPWPVHAIALGAVAFVLILPLAPRDGWIGRIVLAVIFAVAFAFWAAIAWRLTIRALEWRRDRAV